MGSSWEETKKGPVLKENRPFDHECVLYLCITFSDRHVPDNQAEGDFVQYIRGVINDVQGT